MDIIKLLSWSGLVNGIFSLGFGVFIALRGWRNKANKLFLAYTFAIAFWAFSYARAMPLMGGGVYDEAYFWNRMLNFGALWIPIFFFHWLDAAFGFSREQKYIKYVLFFGYAATLAISFFAFTPLFVRTVEPELFFKFWPKPGILYHFYIFGLYVGLFLVYAPILLYKKYKQTSSVEKRGLMYLSLGIILGAAGGGTNFFLWYGIPIAPYGNFLVPVWVFLMGYGTVRYHTFGPKVITTEFLVFLIWSFLLSRIFLAADSMTRLIDIFLFLFVLVIGILLIGSVRREVRQRETLEKLSGELKDLNENLEQKVAEQTIKVRRAYEVEKRARIELEELDKAKDRFILTTQHHLRTPLTIIKGYIQSLLGKPPQTFVPQTENRLKKVNESTDKLSGLINKLLRVTELQVGKGTTDEEVIITKDR